MVELYKEIYRIGKTIPKRDRFGIWARIESTCLEGLTLTITGAISSRSEKRETLQKLRIAIEINKHLIRLSKDTSILSPKNYIIIERQLQEASKMTSGWLKYIEQKTPQ